MGRDNGDGAAPLDWSRVLGTLHTRHVAAAGAFLYLAESPSTNTHARALADAGAYHGTVVIADHQTAGRGRLGRSWAVPPRTALTLSIILRPGVEQEAMADATQIVLATAVAVYDLALHDLHLPARLKWPNDLLLGGRKACGILAETVASPHHGRALVVGIGLNVNAIPPGLEERASCLAAVAGAPLEREAVLQALLHRLDAVYEDVRTGSGSQDIWRRWKMALETLGRPVTVYLPGGDTLHGLAEDVTPDGALLVRAASGLLHTLYAGDVSLSPLATG